MRETGPWAVHSGSKAVGGTPRAAAIVTRSSMSQRRRARSVRLRAVLVIGRPIAVQRAASWCWVRPRASRMRSIARGLEAGGAYFDRSGCHDR